MKKTTVLSVLRIVLVTVWRLALVAAALAALVYIGLHMALDTVLNGPSEAARNQLTLTLLESEYTRDIPGHFLDQATIDAICAVPDTLPAQVSDPSRITMDPTSAEESQAVVDGGHYSGQITLLTDPAQAGIHFTGGANYAGFTAEGVLILAATPELAHEFGITGTCSQILMMDGQANEGLFAASSGYAPRTAIGQRADGTVILVTTDGWTKEHPGATYQDLINIMTHYGAVNACIIGSSENEG